MNFDFKTYTTNNLFKKLERDSMSGWYNIENIISEKEIKEIKKTAEFVQKNCDVFIVIGIGGSFLGAKCVIDSLSPYFTKNKPEIIFAGTSLSTDYLYELGEYIKDKEVILNIISKSGTTLEPSLAFEYLTEELSKKYTEEELSKRIIATTDQETGDLLELAKAKKYKRFVVPNNVGGRYSVLTPVGLLPICVAGYDIEKLLEGAKKCDKDKALEYAFMREEYYKQGFFIEAFTIYEEKLLYFTEWLKQLFAETQGKDGRGILPISIFNTRDLHSLGQYLQEGKKIIFETTIKIKESKNKINTKYNKTLQEINEIAIKATAQAHLKGGSDTNIIEIDKIDEENIGKLIYFFELSAALGGLIMNINPFDQPGVNEYKKIIKELL